MDEDESTFEIPDYILSRLQPTLEVSFPNREDEIAILEYHLPFAEKDLIGKRLLLTTATGAIAAGPAGPGVTYVKVIGDADPAGYVYVDVNNNGVKD